MPSHAEGIDQIWTFWSAMLTSKMRLPLQTLPAFRAVARLANLRAAAAELHLTHSAVSQQIKLLEEQLGFALFDRPGRRVALNAAGEALLRAIEPALTQIDDGMRAAAAAASGAQHRLRVTLLPSFAQRWLLPRMAGWRERHPEIAIELHTSQQLVDLPREGFHAALRQGSGQWRGLEAERLLDSPLIAVGSPNAARRLLGRGAAALADEPLLGDVPVWESWFALSGVKCRVNPVASFNDAGLMLQAAEQDLGLALARELLVADALRDGRLRRLSPVALSKNMAYALWFAYPEGLRDWPPLAALRAWLLAELDRSQRWLNENP
jgi:LysR family glycine cleavage system transcriptional activator